MYIVHSGASLHVMDVNSFTSQEGKHVAIQTAIGFIRSKERRFTSRSWWHIILKCCSLNDPYDELGHSNPWHRGEHLQIHEKTDEFGIPCCGHKGIGYSIVGYESKRARHRQRKAFARQRSGGDNVSIAGTIFRRCGRRRCTTFQKISFR